MWAQRSSVSLLVSIERDSTRGAWSWRMRFLPLMHKESFQSTSRMDHPEKETMVRRSLNQAKMEIWLYQVVWRVPTMRQELTTLRLRKALTLLTGWWVMPVIGSKIRQKPGRSTDVRRDILRQTRTELTDQVLPTVLNGTRYPLPQEASRSSLSNR